MLFELYTGVYLFDALDDETHLCLIEKICGHFTKNLLNKMNDKNKMNLFKECDIHDHDLIIDINKCEDSEEIKRKVLKYNNILNKILEEHQIFLDFLIIFYYYLINLLIYFLIYFWNYLILIIFH